MNSPITRARSFLFVPASRPDRFGKALDSGADCVILDLEDAVAVDQKVMAREQLVAGLNEFTREQLARTLVRINPAGTSWHESDLHAVSKWTARGMAGAVVPKAESASTLRSTGIALGPAACLVALIESVAGLDRVAQISGTPQVVRLAFGHLDFQLDLGMRCGTDERELDVVRFALTAASRRAMLPAPIDGVTVNTTDEERLRSDLQRSRAFGFTGKLCIHPKQVEVANESFSPSAVEVEWARRVLDASRHRSGQAFSLDGRMIDLPVIRLAELTVAARVLRTRTTL